MKIADLMTRDVITCGPEDSADQAARLMWEHDCGVIPVVDAQRRPIGMITDRDVCMAGYTMGRRLVDIRVGDVMTRNVQTCSPEEPVAAAEFAMRQRHVRRLPVIDSELRLVGLLSLNDLARVAAKDDRKPANGLTRDTVAETLASISESWCSINARPAHRPDPARSQRGSVVSVPTVAR
ncbi:MAG: CBS domain-containing protein [Planctomycetota bacterium]|nr:CBS domain-containing protein [Planctomycetota bacterium]